MKRAIHPGEGVTVEVRDLAQLLEVITQPETPSGFRTTRIGLDRGLADSSMMPSCSVLLTWDVSHMVNRR